MVRLVGVGCWVCVLVTWSVVAGFLGPRGFHSQYEMLPYRIADS